MAESNVMGTAGTLVGAILESAGYHYQSYLLDVLKNPLENEVGGLIYLLGIAVAVFYTATQGGFKMTAYLMIGPPLFFAVIKVRGPIDDAKWEFGKSARNQAQVQEGVQKVAPNSGQANVSKLFGRYVQLVGTVNNEIINRLNKGRSGTDLWFVMKAELFTRIHTARIDDIGFQLLFHRSLTKECAEVVKWAKRKNSFVKRMMDLGPMSAAVDEAGEQQLPRAQYAQDKFNELYKLKNQNLVKEEAEWVSAQYGGGMANAGAEGTDVQSIMNTAYSCYDIWKFILFGMEQRGKRVIEKLKMLGEEHNVSGSALSNLILQIEGIDAGAQAISYDVDNQPSLSTEQAEVIQRVIAKYFLRNEDAADDQASWITYFANRHEGTNIALRMQGINDFSEQRRINMREWSEKDRMIHFASSMPYYQGLVLYFLGMTFPFFALLLLVPGKAQGFLLWFALWYWIKSWDIGFAIVMLIDDMLFSLFAVDNAGMNVREIEPEIGAALNALHEMDPTFQMGTYYTLIATCTLAIPVVSAQLILGSLKSGAALISGNMRQYADHFSDATYSLTTGAAQTAGRMDHSDNIKMAVDQFRNNFHSGRALPTGLRQGPLGQMETIGDMRGSDPKTKFSEMPAPGGAAYQVPQTSDADRDSATSAMHAGGYGAEFSSPWNAFGLIQSAPIADNAAKAFLAAHPQVTAQGKTALDIINRERDFALQLAAWRSMLSQKAALIQYEMAICGGLPLPYTNTGNHKGEPSSADFELSVAKFSAGIERRQSTWETVDQVNGAVLGFVKALYPEDGIKTIDDIAKLSEDKRVKAFKLFRQTVAGGGIFADAVTNHDKYTRATQDMVDRARQEDMSSLPSNRSQSRFFSHSVFPQ